MNTSYPREKLKILLLENVNAEAVQVFVQHGYVQVVHQKAALTEDELTEAVKDVHILGIRSKTHVTEKVLAAAPKLLAIGCFCIGVNQVNLAAATAHGIAVFNAPYSNTRSVAELVIGAAIMLIRRIPDKNRMAHEGVWMKDASNSYELRGKTLGIIGYGNIGSQVSVLAEAMGMKVLFYDNQKKLPLGNARPAASLQDVLSVADIISLHVPATAATHHLINKETLQYCKKGALLINYARGEVLDINALSESLDSGQLSGAALDVYPDEPEKNGAAFSCMLQHKSNVLLTPHIGGSTEEAQANIGLDVSSKLVDYTETGASNGSHTVPMLSLPVQEGAHRILHIHKNIPGVLSAINTQLSAHGINILGQYLKTNDDIGYVVLDVNRELSHEAVALLKDVSGTIRLRLLY